MKAKFEKLFKDFRENVKKHFFNVLKRIKKINIQDGPEKFLENMSIF